MEALVIVFNDGVNESQPCELEIQLISPDEQMETIENQVREFILISESGSFPYVVLNQDGEELNAETVFLAALKHNRSFFFTHPFPLNLHNDNLYGYHRVVKEVCDTEGWTLQHW